MQTPSLALFVSFLATASLLEACSPGESDTNDDTDTSATDGYAYQGIGSKWTAIFSGDTFSITKDDEPDGTVDMTVDGTFVQYDNQFRLLTVSAVTGPEGPEVGATGLGLEIPGFAFFLKPLGDDAEPIVMVNAADCPTDNFEANWVISKFQQPDSEPEASSDGLGTAAFDLTSTEKTATVSPMHFVDGTAMADTSIALGDCADGVQQFSETGAMDGTIYLTENGGALVEPNEGAGIIFAGPKLSADATSSDWDGTYSGLVFSSSSDEKVFPGKLTLSGTTGTGVKITDVATDAAGAEGVTIADLAAISGTDGLFRGTVSGQPLNCELTQVNDKKLLACNGADGAAVDGVYPTFYFMGTAR